MYIMQKHDKNLMYAAFKRKKNLICYKFVSSGFIQEDYQTNLFVCYVKWINHAWKIFCIPDTISSIAYGFNIVN